MWDLRKNSANKLWQCLSYILRWVQYYWFAQKILENDNRLAGAEKTTKDSIDIPLQTSIISILTITAILGPIMFLFYQLFKYNEQLALPTMAGIILIFLIIGIAKDLYYKKLIGNSVVTQSVNNKLNNNVIFGIII